MKQLSPEIQSGLKKHGGFVNHGSHTSYPQLEIGKHSVLVVCKNCGMVHYKFNVTHGDEFMITCNDRSGKLKGCGHTTVFEIEKNFKVNVK